MHGGSGEIWEVVGGGDKGGIVVRKGKESSSEAEAARLSTGALVQELQLDGERLRYRRIRGAGPDTGWVSVRLKDGKELMVKARQSPSGNATPSPPSPPQQAPAAPTPVAGGGSGDGSGTWRLLSESSPGRGEQVRLLFRFTGTAFEDKRLTEPEINRLKSNAVGDASCSAFGFPYVEHGSCRISTVAGTMQYVGDRLGLGGSDAISRSRALMHVVGSEAMRNEVFNSAYQAMLERKRRMATYTSMPYLKWMGHFERYLRVSAATAEAGGLAKGPFLLGATLCYADLALYDAFTSIWALGCYGRDEAERAQKFPCICALVQAVAQRPEMTGYGHPHAEFLAAQLGALPDAPAPARTFSPPAREQHWEVTGGGDKGGILVRTGKDTASPAEANRLSTGALVKEVELDGDRLRYKRLTGTGPASGWVSIKLKSDGKELLTRTQALPPVLPEGSWQVLYNDQPGRGQQLRLLFAFAARPFEDKRLEDHDAVDALKSAAIGDASPLAFDFVPILRHGPYNVSTTVAAMQYAGELLGFLEDDAYARARAVMLVVASESMRNDVFYPAYFAMTAKKSKRRFASFDGEAYLRWLGRFELYLSSWVPPAETQGSEGGSFALGPKIYNADLAIYDCLTSIWALGCHGRDEVERTKQFPCLCALVTAMEQRPWMAGYGRPHAEDLDVKVGMLPAPRSPTDPPPPRPALLGRRGRLKGRLAEVDEALLKLGEEGKGEGEHRKAGNISVVIATSKMMAEKPKMVDTLVALINHSNEDCIKDVPSRKGSHKHVTKEEVMSRCTLGDNGDRSNRVLHVAFERDTVVGCISSSYRTPWTEEGVGHWGYLAVDAAAQGKGVASALVAAAMERLAGGIEEVHIEYLHTQKHAYSDRLKKWYEDKLGFGVVGVQSSAAFNSNDAKDTVLRICRRKFQPAEMARGRRLRLAALKAQLTAQANTSSTPAAEDEGGPPETGDGFECTGIFQRLATAVQARGLEWAPKVNAAFQIEVYDAGPEGRFFVDLRPGLCMAAYGDEPSAECRVVIADADLEAWLSGTLDDGLTFWDGRTNIIDDGDHVKSLRYVFGEACKI